jgi:hypothetical protein
MCIMIHLFIIFGPVLRILISSPLNVTYFPDHKVNSFSGKFCLNYPCVVWSESATQKRFLYTGSLKLNGINYAKDQGKITAERHFGPAEPTEC